MDKVRELVDELDPAVDCDCAFLLAVCMGLRRGEVCGLSWGDVDFEAGTLSVEHSVDRFGNLKGPKTKAGRRILPMPESVSEALRTLRRAQRRRVDKINEGRRRSGHHEGDPIVLGTDSPVIVTISGTRLNPATLSKWWSKSRGLFGLDGVTFHELRHTYLSMLALSGAHPKVMQELAGHSDPKMTMQVYTHLTLDARRDAVDKLFDSLDA